ncbi:MAG: response regulator [Parcubacteria group bacterium]|nr:response regulator [Parcubacteria group bacterium]
MKKILIVDDDMTFVAMMKAALDPKKYEVTSAGNGIEALSTLEESMPDLILLDIMMPKMDGIEFLTEMNKKYGEHKTSVLITSNNSSLDKISEGVALGIKGYFIKSNESLHGIIAMIESALPK